MHIILGGQWKSTWSWPQDQHLSFWAIVHGGCNTDNATNGMLSLLQSTGMMGTSYSESGKTSVIELYMHVFKFNFVVESRYLILVQVWHLKTTTTNPFGNVIQHVTKLDYARKKFNSIWAVNVVKL